MSRRTAIYDQRHGVAWYWLVHPGSVSVYLLINLAYDQPAVFGPEYKISLLAFPDLVIPVAVIFRDLPPLEPNA
ncbi:MAG: hypothetical protein PHH58_10845 [Rhodoferax sp.]|nr:hypothetical protein [Rhodoferax sp.]